MAVGGGSRRDGVLGDSGGGAGTAAEVVDYGCGGDPVAIGTDLRGAFGGGLLVSWRISRNSRGIGIRVEVGE